MATNPIAYNAKNYKAMYALGAAAAGYTASTADNWEELQNSLIFGTGILGGAQLALQGGAWLFQNKGDYSGALKRLKQQISEIKDYKKAIKTGSHWNPITFGKDLGTELKLNSIKNSIPNVPRLENTNYEKLLDEGKTKKAAKIRAKHLNRVKKANCYSQARQEFELIKSEVKAGRLKGNALKARLARVTDLVNESELKTLKAIKAGKLKASGFWGKVAQKTGMNKIERGFLEMATNKGTSSSAKLAKFLGKGGKAFMKGGGPITFLIEFGMEVPEIAETFNKLGTGAGLKQVAKSAAVACASAAGWVVGAKAGAAIGTAICPGLGTFIGGLIGIAGGIFGSWLFGKGAKAIVGPSELEKAKKAAAQKYGTKALEGDKGKVEVGTAILDKAALEGGINDQTLIDNFEKILGEREDLYNQCVAESDKHITELTQQQEQQAITQPEGNIFANT